jgi:hypothetical protein
MQGIGFRDFDVELFCKELGKMSDNELLEPERHSSALSVQDQATELRIRRSSFRSTSGMHPPKTHNITAM